MKIRLLSILCILLMSLSIEAQTEEFETAAEAVKNMKVGVNLGNTLESVSGELNNMWIEANTERRPQDYETAWGNPVTKAELMKMWRKAGYNAVRVPVSWYPHTGKIVIEYKPIKNEQGQEEIKPCWDFSKWEGYDVDPAWMKRVHEVVDYVIDQGMYCIINLHHDAGAPDGDKWVIADETNYEQNHERFEAIWRQIAEEFKDYDEHLLFEGYNEIVDKWNSWGDAYSFSEWSEVSPGVWGPTGHDEVIEQSIYRAVNKYAQSFVDAVRATGGNNKVRNLIVNVYCGCGSEKNLENLSVPKDEIPNHIAFQLHYYVGVFDQNNDITYSKAFLDSEIERYNRQLTQKGVPLIIGEWGFGIDPCPEKAFEYIRYFMERTRDNGIATFDFNNGYISYGDFRSFPAIINADYINAVMKGYYGDWYNPSILTADDYELSVEFTDDHNEFYLCRELDIKYYDGFLLELDDYEEGRLELILVKSYDNFEIVEIPITSTKTYIDFKTLKLEESVKSIILRHKVAGNYNIGIKRSVLRYMDNSEQWSLGGDSNCNLKYKRKQFVHTIAYNDIWSELNLYDDDIPLKQKNYKGIRVEFAEPINADVFTLKIYADNGAVTEGKTLSAGTSATILFSNFPIEDVINRITLQYCKEGKTDVKVISAWLIRQDGTEEYSDLSPFWGCEIKEKTPYKAAASKEASNVTDQYLVNPSFNSDLHGWTNTGGTAKWKENNWEALNNYCEFEWTGGLVTNQKVVQTITLPAGSYRLSVTCASDPGSSGLYLIAGSYSKEMLGTGGVVDSFSLDFNVAEESAISIGMKVENTTATWVNFDNFKLERLESTTDIHGISTTPTKNNTVIYNLWGQKLAKPQKGINIINGKKVLVK